MSRRTLDRRTFLRGAGVSIALPALEAMFDAHGTALAQGGAIPRRFVVWFWGNGNEPDRWTPAAAGNAWTPSEPLQALAPIKDYVSVVTGMGLATLGKNNPHVEGVVGIMGGTNPALHPSFTGAGGDWNYMSFAGPSLDQVIAGHIGSGTRFKSLEVGATTPHGSSGPGSAISYISHTGPYNPNRYSQKPDEVFTRLFGGAAPTAGMGPDPMLAVRASVLDVVKQDAAALKQRLGVSDRRRLDDHLEAIRALEQRVKATARTAPASPTCKTPARPVAVTGERARARVMGDLVAMALACDLTRVVTFEFSSPATHVSYEPFPGKLLCNGSPTSFHEYEHCNGFTDTTRTVLRYFVEEFARFAALLKATPEGSGNLLDHACLFGTSEVADGWVHKHDNFPLLLAGRAGGALKSGLHVPIGGDAASRNAARVPLTILRAFGVPQGEWGTEQFATRSPVTELLA